MKAITAGEQAVALAERLADTTWLGYAEYGLGQAYFLAGRYREAEECLESGERASCRRAGKRAAGNDGIEPSRALPYDEGAWSTHGWEIRESERYCRAGERSR